MHCFKFPFFLFLSSLFLYASLAEIICEDLPRDVCAFSISSSGKRCLLETAVEKDNEVEYECRTSGVVVERMAGYIESDKCVRACGVDRNSVGISSDSLREPRFTAKLCAPACCHNCPNIVDLFFNLAAGEGMFLPNLCAAQRTNPRRSMVSKSEATRYSIFGETPPSPIFDDYSDLAPSSEEALGPNSSEESDLAPSSDETPDPISSEESDLAPSPEEASGPISDEESDLSSSFGEAPGPIYGEASAPTPAPLGALTTTLTLTPGPTPMGALVLAPTSAPLGAIASTSTSTPGPTPIGALASTPNPTPTPAPIGTLASAPTPTPLGALASTPTPTPTPIGALTSSSTSAPGPASLGPIVSAFSSTPTPSSPLEDLASASISAPGPSPFGALISDLASGSTPTPTPMG